MNSRSVGLSIGLLFALCTNVSSAQLKTSDMIGVNKCGFVFYEWPTSAEDRPKEIGKGTLTDQGDGAGHWKSASARFSLDGHTSPCDIEMESGTYIINPDGSLTSTIKWKVKTGDAICGRTISEFVAGDLGSNNPNKSVAQVYPGKGGIAHQISFGSAGFIAGSCELDKK